MNTGMSGSAGTAVSQQISHSVMNRIVEELSEEERKRLVYLCGALDSERCADHVREMLLMLMEQEQMNRQLLMELMVRMQRYDLLKCVLNTTRTEAERLLKNSNNLSEYRILMDELSENLSSSDLKSLVFLLRGTLPTEKAEKIECFLDLVVELERLDLISSSRMEVMEQNLRAIHRVDLARRLSQYQSRAERPEHKPTMKNTLWRPCLSATPNSLSGIPPTSCGKRQVLSRPCAASAAVLQRSSISQRCERVEDEYRMQSRTRGLCVIIDCVGTEGVFLQQLFESLSFRVSLHSLLSVQDMLSTLQDVSKQREHYTADAFICCIISRRCSSGLLGTDPRGSGLGLDYIRQLFTPEFCPGLAGKPKLFFIQSYEVSGGPQGRGRAQIWDYEDGELETDGPAVASYRPEVLPADADVFWSHCSTEEHQLKMVNHRSVYLQSLRGELQEAQRRRIHMVDVHMAVNGAVYDHNYKHPRSSYSVNLRHTLRKHVYFC
ncbi:CASP8 and FADD-like apoptosis regulator [Astyanax mexicanus]|uniref:CASP8 and FADD-like apoptosis regulator n=1 Tax=Astyanax mexicanus TaxID=7994 RepID=UPI0020CB35D9|nr:CASP8 and FADD-like apoptosis regulator [Astyanax mexicanus]XP_049341037.1 CASP8 and FADD-like apoptosis regulator [Astyanax mexicanus]